MIQPSLCTLVIQFWVTLWVPHRQMDCHNPLVHQVMADSRSRVCIAPLWLQFAKRQRFWKVAAVENESVSWSLFFCLRKLPTNRSIFLTYTCCSLNFCWFPVSCFWLSPSFSHLCFTSKTSCATPLAVDQGIAPDSSWTDLWALDASNSQRHPWHLALLALLALQVCVLGTATGSGQEGRLQFGSWSTQTLGENPKCWWSLMVVVIVEGCCDRGDSLESFPKFWETIAALAETSPHISCQNLKLTFLNSWLGLLALQNIPNIMFPTPKWALVLGSGHWRPGICVLRRTSSRSRCPRIRCLISKPKKPRLRREHVVTSQRLATNHAHISWIHPIARWGILWRPTLRVHILICKDLCISIESVHISQNFLQTSLTTDIPKPWAHHHAGINLQWPAGRFPDTATEHRLGKAGAALHLAEGLERSALEKFERIQTSKENLFHSSSISFWNKNAASNKL